MVCSIPFTNNIILGILALSWAHWHYLGHTGHMLHQPKELGIWPSLVWSIFMSCMPQLRTYVCNNLVRTIGKSGQSGCGTSTTQWLITEPRNAKRQGCCILIPFLSSSKRTRSIQYFTLYTTLCIQIITWASSIYV